MRVCIIGAGSSGLPTAKHLREQGIEVEILEARDGLGGLWYFDERRVGFATDTNATSSKAYLQYSDFPMGAEVSSFPHHSVYLSYLHRYAQHHDLLSVIHCDHEVLDLRRDGGLWHLTVRHKGTTHTRTADAVVICSGVHQTPLIPEFPGASSFTGQVIHSSLLKSPEPLRGKRVVVVGGGESGTEMVHGLAPIASEVYLSLRKGIAATRHWSPFEGLPADFDATRAKGWLPREFLHDYNVDTRLFDRHCAFKTIYTLLALPFLLYLKQQGSVRATGLVRQLGERQTWRALFHSRPRHGPPDGVALAKACRELLEESMPQTEEEIAQTAWRMKYIFDWYSGAMHNSQPFTKRVAFLHDIAAGDVEVVPGLAKFTGGLGVAFDGGEQVEADAVVMCTGFQSSVPFLQDESFDGRTLYKNVFSPDEPSLAFIGFVRPNLGSLPATAEMQSRWLASVLSGRISLPTPERMREIIADDARCYTDSRKAHVKRLTYLVDYHKYMDELAGYVGCRPQLWRMLTRPKLMSKLLFGPMGSFQYRLDGYGRNPEAALEAISQIPDLPIERILLHLTVLSMKPWFHALGRIGLDQYQPVF